MNTFGNRSIRSIVSFDVQQYYMYSDKGGSPDRGVPILPPRPCPYLPDVPIIHIIFKKIP